MLIGAIIALTHFEGLFCNAISLFPICVEGNCFSWSPCRILLRLITEYYGGHLILLPRYNVDHHCILTHYVVWIKHRITPVVESFIR